MSGPARREFIPEIRAMIAKAAPMTEEAVNEAIDRWRDGEDPRHPLDAGVFAMCDRIAEDIDEKADAQPDLDDLEDDDE